MTGLRFIYRKFNKAADNAAGVAAGGAEYFTPGMKPHKKDVIQLAVGMHRGSRHNQRAFIGYAGQSIKRQLRERKEQ